MPSYDMTGTVKEVMDEITFDSGFNKREFVVTSEDDRFPQDIKFECVKDKCALLNDYQPGQRITVTFDLRGNNKNSTGRYFVNLTAWRIQTADQAAGDQGGGAPANANAPAAPTNDGPPLEQMAEPFDDPDNLPF